MEFREFLQDELLRRQQKNPAFSQRAFARLLQIDSSRLSKMLRGERPIRPEIIEDFALRLGLKKEEVLEFVENPSPRKNKQYKQLELDQQQIFSNWHHDAILEMIKLPFFVNDADWIAQALKCSAKEVTECIQRLIRIGFIKKTNRGTLKDLTSGQSTYVQGPNVSSLAHRSAQMEILRLAQEALINVPIEERDQSSMMMTTSYKKILQAKEKIKRFRRELCAFLESGDDKDVVMQLSVSLFPIAVFKEGNKK